MADITSARPVSGQPVASAWGGEVHDQLEGIQAGSVNVALSAANSGTAVVTFPRAYVSAPFAVAQIVYGATSWICTCDATTPTTMTVRVTYKDTGNFSVNITVHWIAIGTPA